MTTRAEIIARAFGRLGITDYEFSVTPDERENARGALDSMMAEWSAVGVALGYTPSIDGDNDADQMTTPDYADAPIINNLALLIAPDFGKTASPSLAKDAKRGYNLCVTQTLMVPTVANGNAPFYGGGYRWYGDGFN